MFDLTCDPFLSPVGITSVGCTKGRLLKYLPVTFNKKYCANTVSFGA